MRLLDEINDTEDELYTFDSIMETEMKYEGLEAVKKLYEEREYSYGESVNHKSSKWENDIRHYDNIGECLLIIEKELKALEIIKERQVNIKFLLIDTDCELYNMNYGYDDLTQEEYDLLKEVLK